DLLLIQDHSWAIGQWTDIKNAFANHSSADSVELYGSILLLREDVLNTGKSRHQRLREAYLLFASNDKYKWGYYIIDYLLDDGNYELDAVDYFFYVRAAGRIGVSKDELDSLIENAGYQGLLVWRIDEYLFQPEEREVSEALEYAKTPHQPGLSHNQLVLVHL